MFLVLCTNYLILFFIYNIKDAVNWFASNMRWIEAKYMLLLPYEVSLIFVSFVFALRRTALFVFSVGTFIFYVFYSIHDVTNAIK